MKVARQYRTLNAFPCRNSSLAGTHKAIEDYIETLREDARFRDVDFKTSQTENSRPFPDLFVKCVPEIISTGKKIVFLVKSVYALCFQVIEKRHLHRETNWPGVA